MKQPFRFHRGELNGAYIYAFVTCLNKVVPPVIDELAYWRKVQFITEAEVSSVDEVAMRDTDIIGIGKFAGVFPLVFAGGSWYGMVHFSEALAVAGKNRSERGLYNIRDEAMEYVRTDSDDYPDDIATQASPENRMTLVPHGTPILGYVRADEDLYDTNGNVIWDNVHPTPPVGVAYDPFYGDAFSTMSSDAFVISQVNIELVKTLIEIMQRIRYEGVSVGAFLALTKLLCEGYVYDIDIQFETFRYIVYYKTDAAVSMDNRAARFAIWEYVTKLKFKHYELSEVVV